MRKFLLTGTTIIAATLALASCSGSDDSMDSSMSDSSMPSSSMSSSSMPSHMTSEVMSSSTRMGNFEGLNGKMVAGTAKVTDSEIMLSGFSSDEGPDLHVYLTNGTDEAAVNAGMEIDPVAFNQSSQTFTLKDVKPGEYNNVVIHCDKAKAVFGAASLA